MNDTANPDNDQTFQKLLADCLESLENGEPIDRDQLRRDHPGHADSICEFLDNNDLVVDAIVGLRDGDEKPVFDTAFAPTMDSHSQNPSKRFEIGDSLRYVGEYEIVDEIARGGMGIVFRAQQSKLRRDVALKMILAGRLASEADVDRFHREARAAAALKHPNIVSVHEVGQYEGHHYFTMDFVDGRSLASMISEETLSPRKAAELLKTVALAIEYSHEHGVLHRDLKPANILIDADGQPHVTDFGLAKTLAGDVTNIDLTSTGQILGTPSYMAPEQASAKHQLVSVESDVYSLGAILYACLSGRGPFIADSVVDTIRQVIEKEPVSPRLLNPQVPKDLETICLKCLQKEPHQRYATAEELAEDLGRFLEDRSVVARPVSSTTKLWRWGKRNPSIASLLLLSLLLLVSGAAVSSYFAVEAGRRADAAALSADVAIAERVKADRARDLAVRRQAETRKQLYVAQINQAQAAWNQNNVLLTNELLERQIPHDEQQDLRGFEWRYLNRLRQGQKTIDVEGYTRSAGISPDGRLVALKKAKFVELMDLETGKSVGAFDATDTENSAAPVFSFDGTLLAFGGENQVVTIVRVMDQKILHLIDLEKGFHAAGLSLDSSGQFLAVAITTNAPSQKETRIECWDIKNFRRIVVIDHPHKVLNVAFRPHHPVIAASDHQSFITQWNMFTGEIVKQWMTPQWPSDFAFDPTGDVLATGGEMVSVLQAESGQLLTEFPVGNSLCSSLQFHPNGNYLVGGRTGRKVTLWDLESRKQIRSFSGHSSLINSVAFRPRLKEIVSVDEGSRIKLWRTDEEIGVTTFADVKSDVGMAIFCGDGTRLAACERRTFSKQHPGRVDIWDVDTRERLNVLNHSAGVASIAVNANGSRLLSATYDGKIMLWDVMTGDTLHQYAIDVEPSTVRFHPRNASLAAICDQTGRVAIFDVTNPAALKFHSKNAQQPEVSYASRNQRLSFHPDGELLAVCGENQLTVYDIKTMESVCQKDIRHLATVEFNPDGRTVVCSSDSNLHVFDVENWNETLKFSAHSRSITGIGFNRNGTRMATNSDERLLKLWETETYQTVFTTPGDIPIPQFSPDGSMLVRGRRDNGLELCDTRNRVQDAPSIDGAFCEHRSKEYARSQYWNHALADSLACIQVDSNDYVKLDAASYALMAGSQEIYRELVGNAIVQFEREGVDKRLRLASRWAALAFMVEGVGQESPWMKTAAEKSFEMHRTPAEGISLLYCLLRLADYETLIERANTYETFRKNSAVRAQAAAFRAISFYELGNFEKANAEMQREIAAIESALPPVGEGRNTNSDYSDWLIATVVIHQEACARALTHLNKAIEAEPNDLSSLQTRAALHELFQRWDLARKDYQQLVVLDQDNIDHWLALTKVAALSGNTDAYRQLCPLLIERSLSLPGQGKLWAVARTCALLPDVEDAFSDVFDEPISEYAKSRMWHIRIAAVGLQYRRGNFQDAADTLGPTSPLAKDWQGKCRSMLWEALIQFQLDEVDQARQTFHRANAIITANFPSPGYAISGKHSIAELELLRNEARRLLDQSAEDLTQ